MADLRNSRVIIAKGLLFLALGVLASTLLFVKALRLDVALLHGLAVWAFCRFYYFAFYVIQNYVDPGFRFSGLTDFCHYLATRSEPVAEQSEPTKSRPDRGAGRKTNSEVERQLPGGADTERPCP